MYKKTISLCLPFLTLLLLSLSGCQKNTIEPPPPPEPLVVPFVVTQLAQNVYLLKEDIEFTANIIMIVGENEVILLDSGFENAGDALRDKIQELQNLPVQTIIHSHEHGDHTGGDSILENDGVIIGHTNGILSFQQFNRPLDLFSDEYFIQIGEEEIECYSMIHGHSRTDIAIYLKEAKILYLGDMYLSESFPVIGIEDGSSVQQLIINLDRVVEMFPDAVTIIPGHGRTTNMNQLKNYIEMVKETTQLVVDAMNLDKTRTQIHSEDTLSGYEEWEEFFPFIDKTTWIDNIYDCYIDEID